MKKFIAVFISIFSITQSYAQQADLTPAQWDTEHKKTIGSAAFIFEGTIVQQKCYYYKHVGGQLLTCTIIKITKIYKGSPQLKLGTIKVITEQGGGVGNEPYVMEADANGLGGKGHYIIFANSTNFEPADTTLKQSLTTDNLTVVGCFDHIDFKSRGPSLWDGAQYKNLNDIYSFLSNCGLTVEEELGQQENPTDSTKH